MDAPVGKSPALDSVHPNLLLLAVPTAAASAAISRIVAFGLLLLICATALVNSHRSTDRIRLTVASLILPAAGLLIAARPNLPETPVGGIFQATVCCAFALAVSVSRTRSSAVVSLVDGIGFLLVMAIIVRFAGIGSVGGTGLVVTGNLLTGGERVTFALAGSIVNAPALAAAYLVAAIPIMRQIDRHRTYRAICVIAAAYVLVQGDRRSALLSAFVILALIVFAPRVFRKYAPWMIGLLLTLPFSISILQGAEQVSIESNVSERFLRAGEKGLTTLNERLQIWSRAIEFYQNRVDWFHQSVGFGTFGQAVSGASMTYRDFFAYSPDNTARSPHNSVIQALFDGGWILAFCFVITVIWLAWSISRRHSVTDLACLGMLTSLTIVGCTEAVLAPGYPQPVWWTLMAIGMITFAQDNPITISPHQTTTDTNAQSVLSGRRSGVTNRRFEAKRKDAGA